MIESTTHPTPNSSTERARRLFEAHLSVLKNPQSTSNYGEFLTDDAVYEFPFAPGEFPSRIEGKEAVIKYMTDLPPLAKYWQFREVTFSETTNPDVFFVEFIVSAEAAATGRKYEQPVIARYEMRGEKISVNTRDSGVLYTQHATCTFGFSLMKTMYHEQSLEASTQN